MVRTAYFVLASAYLRRDVRMGFFNDYDGGGDDDDLGLHVD